MSIRDQLVQLSELGRYDHKMKELQDRRIVLQKKAEEASQRREQFSQKEALLAAKTGDLLAKKKLLDGDLGTERGNLRKWESRAEKIRGEREYNALMSEIGTQKRTIVDHEAKLQEVNKELDGVNKDLAAANEAASEAKKVADEEWSLVREALDALEEEVKQLLKIRETLSQKLPVTLFKRYEQISLRRGGFGVAVVAREVCQACSRTIPPELFSRIVKGELIEQCPSCQRILVTENMTTAVTPISQDE